LQNMNQSRAQRRIGVILILNITNNNNKRYFLFFKKNTENLCENFIGTFNITSSE